MSEQINRRDFFKRAAVGTAGVSLAMSGASTGSVLGANDRIRLGLIGCGRQGVDNMRHFMRQGVEVAAVRRLRTQFAERARGGGRKGESAEGLSASTRQQGDRRGHRGDP